MKENLTRELVESHLMSFIEIQQETGARGVVRYAWTLSPMCGGPINRQMEPAEGRFSYKSAESVRNHAMGWIRKNRPDLEKAAAKEALEGIRYRAYVAGKM